MAFFCSETLTVISKDIFYPSLFSDILEKVVLNSTGNRSYTSTKQALKEGVDSQNSPLTCMLVLQILYHFGSAF